MANVFNVIDNNSYPLLTCGVDEAGRGPLAGSVYAGAVILDPTNPIEGLMDSKKLNEKTRERLYIEITQKALAWSIAYSTASEIDEINILQATLLAMKRAIETLKPIPEMVLIDGNKAPKLDISYQTIVKGDSLIQAISAASILAKVTRDRELIKLDTIYPQYGFAQHKGYGTKLHLEAIQRYGVLVDIHRFSFSPVAQNTIRV